MIVGSVACGGIAHDLKLVKAARFLSAAGPAEPQKNQSPNAPADAQPAGPNILKKFYFLDKMNEAVCPCFKNEDLKLNEIWRDEAFLQFIDQFLPPEEVEKGLMSYVDSIIVWEKEQIALYFERIRELILKMFQSSQEGFLKLLVDRYTEEALRLFIDTFEHAKCAENQARLRVVLTKLKALKALDAFGLLLQSHGFSAVFLSNFYLDKTECKDIVKTVIYPDKALVEQLVEQRWKKHEFDEGAKKVIAKTFREEHLQPQDYIQFIDFTSFNPRNFASNDVYFADQSYFNLGRFNPLFAFYDEQFHEVFVTLYQVVVDFRLHRRDAFKAKDADVLKQFDDFLDAYDFQGRIDHYLMIKILLYFRFEAMKEKYAVKFRKTYTINNPVIKKMNKRYLLRALIRVLIKKYGVKIKINDFEDLLEDNKRQDVRQHVQEYFDQRLKDKVQLKDDDYEFREYLDDLRANKNEPDAAFEKVVRAAILHYIFNSNIYASFDSADLLNYLKDIFFKLQEKEKTPALELLQTVFKEVSEADPLLLLSFDKMIEYFKNPTSKTQAETLVAAMAKSADLASFCTEVALDFATFGAAQIAGCKQNVAPDFNSNFFFNFIKLRSFVKIFQFYLPANPFVAVNFATPYHYFALHKTTVQPSDQVPVIVKKFDEFLVSIQANAARQKEPFFLTYYKFADLIKILNLANLRFDAKDPARLLEINYAKIFFKDLNIFISFFENVKTKEMADLLEHVFTVTRPLKQFYHFNNLYMLIHLTWLVIDNKKTPEKLGELGHGLVAIINSFDPADADVRARKVRVSKHAALLYLILFRLGVDPTYSHYVALLKQELRALAREDLAAFFSLYFFQTIGYKELETFKSVELKTEDLAQKDRAFFLERFIEEFKDSKTVAATELYAFLAMDYFEYLVLHGHFDRLWESNAMAHMVDYVIELSARNKPATYPAAYEKLLAGHMNMDLFNVSYLYAVAYYVLAKAVVFINQTKPGEQPPAVFNAVLADYVNFFASKYFKPKREPADDRLFDYRFNVRNLYVSLALLLASRFPSDKFQLVDASYDQIMNDQTGGYFLAFSPAEREQAAKLKGKSAEALLAMAKKTDEDKDKYRLLNYLNAELRNIFYNDCNFEQFALLLSPSLIKTSKDEIARIRAGCLVSDKKEVIKTEAYHLLSAIVSTAEDLPAQEKETLAYLKQLFTEIGGVIGHSLLVDEILMVYKRVAVREVNVLAHLVFQSFIDTVFGKYKIKDLEVMYDELEKEKVVSADAKHNVMLLMLKDYLIFSTFKATQFTVDDLAKMDIFEILRQKSKFSIFFTSMFINFRDDNPELLQLYLQMYIIMNFFRETNMKTLGFVSQRDKEIDDKVRKEFETYLGSLLRAQISVPLRTKIYYIYLVHLIFSKDIYEFGNKEEEKCVMLQDVRLLTPPDADTFKIDINQLTAYINSNPELVGNLRYYISKMSVMETFYITYRYLQLPSCQIPDKANYTNAMFKWLKLFRPIVPLAGGGAPEFTISSRVKALTYFEKLRLVL